MPISTSDLDQLRHSFAHLLAAAVIELFPGTRPTIGPAIAEGFYYDFDVPQSILESDLRRIEKKMRQLLGGWESFERIVVTPEQARREFADNPYKREMVDELERAGEPISIYQSGKFRDLCRGGHIDDVRRMKPDAFALTHVAGAYWRGDSSRPMLQRIYGTAFSTKPELDSYLQRQAEAKKRDHKVLGPALDLFTFSDLIGSGLPLWTPRGTLIRSILDDFVWELRRAAGYERVEIPHITKQDLYERSGHWEKFRDELFRITTREKHHFAMKPMNCPHHTQIYARRQHSYRELPQRYANTTMCYRDEQTGELSGLSRVRAFTQDDAHVFCRISQIEQEIGTIWTIVQKFYRAVGFKLEVRLSLHDPATPSKYLGDPKQWQAAETRLRAFVAKKSSTAEEAVGEAAFYGPKIDFMAEDALGRKWQVATIQLDMNLPERFDLYCVNESGEHERIVMIHAAIMGSIERFLSILIEHTAGAFPLWLAPVQVEILPVSPPHFKTARRLSRTLSEAGVRVHLDDSEESVGYKIRRAEKMRLPYMIVIGEKERSLKLLPVRVRGRKSVRRLSAKSFIGHCLTQVARRSVSL